MDSILKQMEQVIDLTVIKSDGESDSDQVIDMTKPGWDKPKEKDVIIVAIDPGPVNGGICLFNATKGKVLGCKPTRLRCVGEKIPLEEILDRAKRHVKEDHFGFFARASAVYIEQQLFRTNLSIQCGFYNAVENLPCNFIQSNSLKARYRKYFPIKKKDETTRQYTLNKKNAIKSGLMTLSKKERKLLPVIGTTRKPKYDHNAMDSIWLARYATEVFLGNDLGLCTKEPKNKRKRKK